MKRKYSNPSEEIQTLFNYEWKRAKRNLSPHLDHKKIPKLYTAPQVRRNLGFHMGGSGVMMLKVSKGNRWVKNSHVIVIREGEPLEKVKHTMRHEICHVIEQNHGTRFHALLNFLEKQREIEERMIGPIEMTTPPEVATY